MNILKSITASGFILLLVSVASPALADHNVSHDSTTDWTTRYDQQHTDLVNVATSVQAVTAAVNSVSVNGGTTTIEVALETLENRLEFLNWLIGWGLLLGAATVSLAFGYRLWKH